MYITRFAPSPTGSGLHIGNVRTAYFNWLAARSTNGKFILRIDDTDIERNKSENVQTIFDTMNWLDLDYDFLEYQSKRLDRYKEIADSLLNNNIAYEQSGAYILNIKDINIPESFDDELAGNIKITDRDKELMIPSENGNGIVLIRSNGMPTYHFACVVDDIDMGINYIIRGVDHLTNTSRQVAIYSALKASLPKFCHIGLIGINGKKLSKRDEASSILHYKNAGYNPDAMKNFLARLGWGPKVDDKTTALLPVEKMLELFLNGGKMRNTPANMDLVKLNSFDRKYKAKK